MITILSKTNLPQIAAEQWTKTGSAFDMDFINADSLETARALAQKYQ